MTIFLLVPCLRRATSLAYTDADEDAEKMLSFAEDGVHDKEEEWVQTHSGRSKRSSSTVSRFLPQTHSTLEPSETAQMGEIDDIPDLDGPAEGASGLPTAMNKLHISNAPDIDDIPDMEEEGLEEEDESQKPVSVE